LTLVDQRILHFHGVSEMMVVRTFDHCLS
jgi:hypothetical protein